MSCWHLHQLISQTTQYRDSWLSDLLQSKLTRNSSGDEIANVNFLCDDIVHALKVQYRLLHKFRHRSFSATQVYQLFGDIAAYYSNFGHFSFLSHRLGGLGTTYDVRLWLIGKCVVDFLLVIMELFSLGVTAGLRRYERKLIENWRFRSNAGTSNQNSR